VNTAAATTATPTVDFLVRAAREFRRGGWVFTGFHWPVLAGQLAHALDGARFVQVFEAGAGCWEAGRTVPTSTTDYPAYGNALGWTATTSDVLLSMAHRFDRVVLDAGNVDVLGRVNSSFLGRREQPTVRLPGGGGAPDVAARARELVWLHGGNDLRRIQAQVEHVTAAPGPDALVRLHTRWGIVRLGSARRLEELAVNTPGVDEFVAHLRGLGVDTAGPAQRPQLTETERRAAARVLGEAAGRGYAVARRAHEELEDLR
jgi:glutaconate CoA-transferase subunit B